MKTKRCIDCGKRKPIDDFYRLHKGNEARQSRCKPCDNRKRAGSHTKFMRGEPTRVTVRRLPNGELEMVKGPIAPAKPSAKPRAASDLR